ncbi:hypothetical protein [Acinetobacter rudis]|uniref:Uncharacterized protein n=1 Tax=Acinetobacter rudis CIP 110305 TaxID=421052 RepID=S3NB69_9GAMM|nr:hypothetical protein [Acinetobacter rudis]EPF71614.1 hypothetical protein F945_02647 [Acinetobacter rudis CIP 110305]
MTIEENKSNIGAVDSESENCKFIGHLVLAFSIAVGILYIFAFGKVETVRYSEYAGMIKESSWSIVQIGMGVSVGLSGLFWWYIIQKIGSILGYLESIKKN